MNHNKLLRLFLIISICSQPLFGMSRQLPRLEVPENFYTFIGLNFDEYKKDVEQQLDNVKAEAELDPKYQKAVSNYAEAGRLIREIETLEKEARPSLLPISETSQKRYEAIQEKYKKVKDLEDLPRTLTQKQQRELEQTKRKYEQEKRLVASERLQAKKIMDERFRDIQFELAYQTGFGEWKQKIEGACEVKREELKEEIRKLKELIPTLSEPELTEKSLELRQKEFDTEVARNACAMLFNDAKRQAYDRDLLAPAQKDASYFDAVNKGVSAAMAVSPDKKVILNQIVGELLADGLQKLILEVFGDNPLAAVQVLKQKIALKSVGFLPMPPRGPDVQYGIGFTGLMGFNQFDVRLSMYIVQTMYGKVKFSVAIELPEYYKLSNLIPQFKYLDAFSFPKAQLIFSSFEYIHQTETGVLPVEKGVNFLAQVDLSGPLQLLSDLKEKSKYTKSLVFENEPVELYGLIPLKIVDARFKVRVPFYFGVDLRKISLVPQAFSNVINQVTTDEFTLEITPGEQKPRAEILKEKKEAEKLREELGIDVEEKSRESFVQSAKDVVKKAKDPFSFDFKIIAEAGARIILGTQDDPIMLTLLGKLRPSWDIKRSSLSVAANLKNKIQLKWLALGDASLEFSWDAALMDIAAQLGMPFTGIGIKGKIDLGKKGESRAYLEAAGGVRFSSKELPDLLFNVKGSSIRFADLIGYTSQLASQAGMLKQPFPVKSIPIMTLHKVEGYASISTKAIWIGSTPYQPGLGLQAELQLFNKKAGFKIFMNDALKLSGFGYMPHLDVKIKGRELFKLYGIRLQDRGPQVTFNFDPEEPLKGYFTVNGSLEIPALRLKQAVALKWQGWNLEADFESKVAGLTMVFGVAINLKAVPEKPGALVVEKEKLGSKEEVGLPKVAEELTEEELQQRKEEESLKKERKQKLAKWQQMRVTFGFKEDFAEYLTEAARPGLQKLRNNASKKLKMLADKMVRLRERGIQITEREIESVRKSIARTQEKIKQVKEECSQARWYKKYKCVRLAAQKSLLVAQKGYLNMLLNPKKVVGAATAAALAVPPIGVAAVGATAAVAVAKNAVAEIHALRKVTETVLDGAIAGLDFIKAGLTIFRVREAIGEWSSDDFWNGKSPRLVRLEVELNILEKPLTIVLEDIQFDFSNPRESIGKITQTLLETFVATQQNKYVSYMQQFAQA